MKNTTCVLTLMVMLWSGAVISVSESQKLSLETLSQLKWQNRVLIIDASRRSEQDKLKLLIAIESKTFEIEDRDLIWFLYSENSVESNYPAELSLSFGSVIKNTIDNAEQASMVLIGKDGSVKGASNLFDLERMFALIDSMPMRQAEMMSTQP